MYKHDFSTTEAPSVRTYAKPYLNDYNEMHKLCRAQALLPTPSRRPHDRRSMRWVERVVRERVVSKSLCTGETNHRPLERTATYRPYPAGDVALSESRPVNSEPIDNRVAPCSALRPRSRCRRCVALRPKSAKSPISEKVGWLKVAGLVHQARLKRRRSQRGGGGQQVAGCARRRSARPVRSVEASNSTVSPQLRSRRSSGQPRAARSRRRGGQPMGFKITT